MGCAQSKVDNEDAVLRCKERRRLMKEAVTARNAFAAGHMGYAVCLKNTGAALSDYGHGETEENYQNGIHVPIDSHSAKPPPPPPPMDSLPPPPPPLPNFSPSPLKRATSMPEFAGRGKPGMELGPGSDTIAEEREEEDEDAEGGEVLHLRRARSPKRRPDLENGSARAEVAPPRTLDATPVPPMPESKGMAWDYFFIVESMPGPSLGGVEEEDEEEDDDEDGEDMHQEPSNASKEVVFADMGKENGVGSNGEEMEPRTPEKMVVDRAERVHIEHSNTAPADIRRVMEVAGTGPSVSLMKVLAEIDEYFLKASESAQKVSTRLHYQSNFADKRGNSITLLLIS